MNQGGDFPSTFTDYSEFISDQFNVIHFFHLDEQPELNLDNDYTNKTGHNLKTNSSISIL